MGRLDRLAVDNGGTGLSLAPFGPSQLGAQRIVDPLPDALLTQPSKIMIDGLPDGQIVGKHSPGTSGAHQIQDAVDDFMPLVFQGSPPWVGTATGKQGSNPLPLPPAQIGWVFAHVSI